MLIIADVTFVADLLMSITKTKCKNHSKTLAFVCE